MAQLLSLLDLVTLQRNDALTGLVEDVTTYAPEFSQIPVVTRPGTYYEIVSRTALPTSQFRIINNGVAPSKSAFKKQLKEMFYLDTLINVDEAIYKGDDRSVGDILSIEAQGALQSTIITIGSQFYYGTSASANGFSGLRTQLAGTVAAGATTNSTSAYFVWLNPQGVAFDVGNDGSIAMNPFTRQQIAAPSPGTGSFFAWVSNLSCYIGLSIKSQYSVFAVTGIDATHPLTDALAQQLVQYIPLNRRQGIKVFMNRTSHFLLQKSRTAVNQQPALAQNGAPAISAPPTFIESFPIVVSDSITNSESN